jgi:glycosyltransferase involved in cell wall biosynthesis
MSHHKIKILHAIGSLSKGGAEFQCRQLANHLDPARCDVAILCFDEGPNPDLAPHVRPIFVDRGAKWDLVGLWRRIDTIIAEEQPDLLQAWLPEVISVPAAWGAHRRGIPVISGHRNTLSYEGDLTKAVRDRLRLPQYWVSDRIISNFDIEEEPFPFRWLYARKQGSCIFNGLNIQTLRELPKKEFPVRAKHRLMYAGRLAPQKGLPTALQALQLLVDQGYDVHLTLFGEGPAPYEAELHALVDELKIEAHVTFFGQCRDWQAYAGDATALVFPTKGEGTSNVILEALAVGLPVIISDIAMTRQLLKDGETAIIVETDDPIKWATAITTILDDVKLRENLSLGGSALSDSFSVPTMVEQYDKLYQDLLR